eukprot:1176099-Prorocentrum_minimum.AAC.2
MGPPSGGASRLLLESSHSLSPLASSPCCMLSLDPFLTTRAVQQHVRKLGFMDTAMTQQLGKVSWTLPCSYDFRVLILTLRYAVQQQVVVKVSLQGKGRSTWLGLAGGKTVAWLGRRGINSAHALQPLFSAINHVYEAHGLPRIALSRLTVSPFHSYSRATPPPQP